MNGSTELRRMMLALGVGAAALGLTACDSDTNEPGATARAEAVVTDEPETPEQEEQTDGSMATQALVEVSTDGSTWVQLGSLNGITVALQESGDTTSVHGEQDLEAGSYTRARLVLRGATITVNAGSVVGGTTLTSDATIELGGTDGEVVIERQVSFEADADADAATTIVFDLNTAAWLTAAVATAGVVEDAIVQAAATAEVR